MAFAPSTLSVGARLPRSWSASGADAVAVSTEGPIDEQVRGIVPQGVKYAIDPVVGETGTQMYQALAEDGHMLRTADGHEHVRAGWLVGCDGAHSTVRHLLGLG